MLVLVGCAADPEPSQVLVRVNGEEVTHADLELERAFHQVLDGATADRKTRPVKDKDLIEQLIDHRLIVQRARELEVEVGSRELTETVRLHSLGASPGDFEKDLKARSISLEAWMKRLALESLAEAVFKRDNAERVVITPQQVRDYYWQHVTRYRHGERVLLRHIVCQTREQAEAALNELRLGDPFEQVARRYSQGPEGTQGGLLGWVSRKELPKELAEPAFELKKKALSEIIRSPHGWHLLRVDDKQRPRNLSVEEAAGQVRESLRRDMEEKLYKDWLFGLRKNAVIERVEPGADQAKSKNEGKQS